MRMYRSSGHVRRRWHLFENCQWAWNPGSALSTMLKPIVRNLELSEVLKSEVCIVCLRRHQKAMKDLERERKVQASRDRWATIDLIPTQEK